MRKRGKKKTKKAVVKKKRVAAIARRIRRQLEHFEMFLELLKHLFAFFLLASTSDGITVERKRTNVRLLEVLFDGRENKKMVSRILRC